jgi:beta-phosphoglucomutase-like phosphatase (HAD superfamily)
VVVEDSNNGLQAATAAGMTCIVTVSSYTGDEDFSAATIVLSSLGDPGEPCRVLANRSSARPGVMFGAADLAAVRGRA